MDRGARQEGEPGAACAAPGSGPAYLPRRLLKPLAQFRSCEFPIPRFAPPGAPRGWTSTLGLTPPRL